MFCYLISAHSFTKRKTAAICDCFLFVVAGAGTQPHDLRVITKVPLAVPGDSMLPHLAFRPLHNSAPSLLLPPAALRLDSQRATLVGLLTRMFCYLISAHSFTKRKTAAICDCFLFVVAGAGFEPHDLRVMSPTSYRTAPPRDIELFISNIGYYNTEY